MVQLFQGSIFNSKCDLMIIPCDNMGGVTYSIRDELLANNLPLLNREIKTGEIVFIPNNRNFSNSSMVGYAASVDAATLTSNESILRELFQSIKQCCTEHSLQKVNLPLLGTGAGHLDASLCYALIKTIFEDDTQILICVYTLSETIYRELSSKKRADSRSAIQNPRVFISYTGTDPQNRAWVKDFACKLRKCGVNARLDMFHLKPGDDLPQWMTNELIMANKVLLICDKYYAEKADNRKGGVGWETMIIQGDMLARQEQNKYIAILRDPNIDQSLPIYVKSRYALDWSSGNVTDITFNDLLLYLFDVDTEPPLGEIPDFIKSRLVH